MRINQLAICLLLLVVTLTMHSVTTFAAGPTPKTVEVIERSYFLTIDKFKGDQVFNACPVGFHFASYYEIKNGALVYNNDIGYSPHQGKGPPSYWPSGGAIGFDAIGWTKMNHEPSPLNIRNCNDWTSDQNTIFDPDSQTDVNLSGPVMFLNELDWFVTDDFCGLDNRVWCVSDAKVQ